MAVTYHFGQALWAIYKICCRLNTTASDSGLSLAIVIHSEDANL